MPAASGPSPRFAWDCARAASRCARALSTLRCTSSSRAALTKLVATSSRVRVSSTLGGGEGGLRLQQRGIGARARPRPAGWPCAPAPGARRPGPGPARRAALRPPVEQGMPAAPRRLRAPDLVDTAGQRAADIDARGGLDAGAELQAALQRLRREHQRVNRGRARAPRPPTRSRQHEGHEQAHVTGERRALGQRSRSLTKVPLRAQRRRPCDPVPRSFCSIRAWPEW